MRKKLRDEVEQGEDRQVSQEDIQVTHGLRAWGLSHEEPGNSVAHCWSQKQDEECGAAQPSTVTLPDIPTALALGRKEVREVLTKGPSQEPRDRDSDQEIAQGHTQALHLISQKRICVELTRSE